ncbi:MAG: class I SAM-dependent rRNA methyltransferase [Pirellulaceae bacterium]|nr:class I SAM-dependent rRNA methyltransferase [Pirellulaceae bacterium]
MSDPSVPDAQNTSTAWQSGEAVGQVVLKARKTRPFLARHPWVLSSAVASVTGTVADGDVVDVLSEQGGFIARGVFNRRSHVRVRLYTWDAQEPLNATFWDRQLARAIGWRRRLGLLDSDSAARLVFSEADGLSGMVLDRFGPHLVLQVNSLAVAIRLPMLIPLIAQLAGPESITVRSEAGLAKVEGLEVRAECAWGTAPDGPVRIAEHGIRFAVDLAAGQKTGFYLDQRENRRAAASYMRDRRVLDLFCYSGGFALAAAVLGGARDVLGVDSSESAIGWAQTNAELNGVSNVRFVQRECFEMLDELREAGEQFDAVVLDPPRFARNRFHVAEALRAYHRINRVAVDLLAPDGILVTCSCSGSVSRQDFLDMLTGVAAKSRRTIHLLEQRGHASDHPVSLACPENEYLKCLICRVL